MTYQRLFKVEAPNHHDIELTRYFSNKASAKAHLRGIYYGIHGNTSTMRIRRGPDHKLGETGAGRTLGKYTIMRTPDGSYMAWWRGHGSSVWYAEEPVLGPTGRLMSRSTMERVSRAHARTASQTPGFAPGVHPMYRLDDDVVDMPDPDEPADHEDARLHLSDNMVRLPAITMAEASEGMCRLGRALVIPVLDHETAERIRRAFVLSEELLRS